MMLFVLGVIKMGLVRLSSITGAMDSSAEQRLVSANLLGCPTVCISLLLF
jgi:hypothetical protein